MANVVTPLDNFMIIVAAAIHDVGHPGVNNLYLQKTMDPIAVRYNDRSVLENMHLAITFELMQSDPASNWLGLLQTAGQCKTQEFVRKGIIGMVLATDMAKHAEYVGELKSKSVGDSDSGADNKSLVSENKGFLLETLLHASDISNPSKPRVSMLAWTKLVNLEFWAQGDTERREGMDISPLCDREPGMKNLAAGQIGFINFVVLPFYNAIAKIVPECQEAIDGLQATIVFWKEKQEQQLTFAEVYPDE